MSGGVLTAAASYPIFGESYCGKGCGQCYELTNMGYGPTPNAGASPNYKGDKVIVMVTNSCPEQGNEEWCSSPNQYKYKQHFDMGGDGSGSPNGWGNVVVSYKPANCSDSKLPEYNDKMQGDLEGNWEQCKCYGQPPAPVTSKGKRWGSGSGGSARFGAWAGFDSW